MDKTRRKQKLFEWAESQGKLPRGKRSEYDYAQENPNYGEEVDAYEEEFPHYLAHGGYAEEHDLLSGEQKSFLKKNLDPDIWSRDQADIEAEVDLSDDPSHGERVHRNPELYQTGVGLEKLKSPHLRSRKFFSDFTGRPYEKSKDHPHRGIFKTRQQLAHGGYVSDDFHSAMKRSLMRGRR